MKNKIDNVGKRYYNNGIKIGDLQKGSRQMLECDYIVKQIDGDYAHLQRTDRSEEELKIVARALLPMEIYEGCTLHYEMMQYSMK